MRAKIGFITGIASFILIIAAPTPLSLSFEGQKLATMTLLMTIWWLTEAQPFAVTALIALAFMPLLQIDTIAHTAMNYVNSR